MAQVEKGGDGIPPAKKTTVQKVERGSDNSKKTGGSVPPAKKTSGGGHGGKKK